MNDELINRIDFAIRNESTQDYIELLADCRVALSRKYVPMTDEQVDEILSELDEIAVGFCQYEYGLPIHHREERNLMREVIRRAGLEVSNEPK